MKIFFFLFSVFLSFIICCNRTQDLSIIANNNLSLKSEKSDVRQNTVSNSNQTFRSNQIKKPLQKVLPKEQILWLGEISNEDVKPESVINPLENYEMLTKSGFDKTGLQIEVDVLNCGGYLFSATAVKYKVENFEDERWQLDVIPDTMASDAAEKIKQCNLLRRKTENDAYYSETWAVAPRIEKRQSIKTQIDTSETFASLPQKTKKWLDQKIVKSPEECCERSEKGKVSLSDQDSWVDLDGDGKIDWLKVTGIDKNILLRKGDSFSITLIFHRIKGKWVDVTPDFINEGC